MWLIALALVVTVPPASPHGFDSVARVLWLVASIWFILRSLVVGVYVGEVRLVIVGWFWVYRIPRSEIDAFVTKAYNGFMTRGSDTSLARSLGVDIAFDRVRYFNSIVMPNRVAKRVIAGLQQAALLPSDNAALPQ